MPGRDRAIRHSWMRIGLLVAGALCAASALAAGPQNVLPPASTVKGWKAIGAPKLYNSNNLFNLIDGEAEAVMAYAFAGEAHAEYAPAGQSRPVLTIDVFDMTDPLNAFGLFSSSDRMSGKPVAIGAEGVRIAPSGLNFWKGRYVVRTTIVQVNPASKAALEAFARAAAGRIQGAGGPPPALRALPPGRQPRSEKYVRANVAGHSFLKNAVTARYPQLGQGAELFLAQYPNPAAAKAALEAYRSFEKSGAGLAPLKGVGDTGFRVVDRYAEECRRRPEGAIPGRRPSHPRRRQRPESRPAGDGKGQVGTTTMAQKRKQVPRRKFLEIAGGTVLLGGLYGLTFVQENGPARLRVRAGEKPAAADLVVVEGTPHDYAAITERAINEFGGIEKFVKKGDRVVLAPTWAGCARPSRPPRRTRTCCARSSSCASAPGAARITCIDYTLDDWKLAFDICGAQTAVRGTRAALLSPPRCRCTRTSTSRPRCRAGSAKGAL